MKGRAVGMGVGLVLLLGLLAKKGKAAMTDEFKFGDSSSSHKDKTDPTLWAINEEALRLSPVDYSVTQSLRSAEYQAQLVAEKKSKKLDSPHVARFAGDKARAIDVLAVGPERDQMPPYVKIAEAFRQAAEKHGRKIRWGGAWIVLEPGQDLIAEVTKYVKRVRANGDNPLIDPGHFELA